MADIDINELQNVAALADADELLAIVAGLGKNVTWAKVKELLTAQLPDVQNSSKGFLSQRFFRIISGLGDRVDKAALDKALDYSGGDVCKIQLTYFVGNVTPTANYALVLRYKIDGNTECQYFFDFSGAIYYRNTSNDGASWSSLRLIAKPS